MSFISDNDRMLVWAIVNAFRQPDCPLTTDQIAERNRGSYISGAGVNCFSRPQGDLVRR